MSSNPEKLEAVLKEFELFCRSALESKRAGAVVAKTIIDDFLKHNPLAAISTVEQRQVYLSLSTVLKRHLDDTEIESDIDSLASELASASEAWPIGELPPAPLLAPKPKGGTELGLPVRYEPIERIGEGGLGQIWRVRDTKLQRVVAIKTLLPKWQRKPQIWERLLREAALSGQLQHPGVPPLYDSGSRDNGVPFFSMKIVQGETLSKLIKEAANGQGRSLHQLLTYFASVAQTIAYAHGEGIVHRDLKPSNVMVGQFGEVQVMDWGLAKRQGLGDTHPVAASADTLTSDLHEKAPEVTRVGDVLGTPRYMPPEQARGDIRNVDSRSDVYSLGAILYEIVTGHRLLDEFNTSGEVLEAAKSSNLASSFSRLDTSDADPAIRDLVVRSLAPNPDSRPRTAAEIVDVLTSYFERREQRLREAKEEQTRASLLVVEEKKRRRIAVGLVAVLTAGILGTGWGMFRAQAQWQRAEDNAAIARDNEALAVASAKQARENAGKAEKNAAVAESNAIAAEQVVQDFYTRVSEEELFDTPSLQLLRQQFLDSALVFYERRLGEAPDNNRIRFAHGELLFKSAKATLSRGEIPKAYDLNEQAIEQLKSIELPANAEEGEIDYHDWAHASLGQAYLLRATTMMRMGKGPECIPWFQLSEEILTQRTERAPADTYTLRQLGELYSAWGNLLTNSPTPEQAMSLFEKSKSFRARILLGEDADEHDTHALARTYWDIGYCYRLMSARAPIDQWREQLTESLANYGWAVEYLEQLTIDYPNSLNFLTTLGDVYNTIAVAHSHRNDRGSLSDAERKVNYERALQAHKKSLTIKQQLVEQNPGIERLEYNLGRAYLGIATQYKFLNRLDEAEESLTKALLIRQQLANNNPDAMQYQEGLANVLTNLGLLQLKQEKPEAAIDNLEKSEQVYKMLIERAPGNSRMLVNLSMTMTNVALGLIELGQFDTASEKMLEAKQTNPGQSDLSLTIARYQAQLAASAVEAKSELAEQLKQLAVDSLQELYDSAFLSADDLRNPAFAVLEEDERFSSLVKALAKQTGAEGEQDKQ